MIRARKWVQGLIVDHHHWLSSLTVDHQGREILNSIILYSNLNIGIFKIEYPNIQIWVFEYTGIGRWPSGIPGRCCVCIMYSTRVCVCVCVCIIYSSITPPVWKSGPDEKIILDTKIFNCNNKKEGQIWPKYGENLQWNWLGLDMTFPHPHFCLERNSEKISRFGFWV